MCRGVQEPLVLHLIFLVIALRTLTITKMCFDRDRSISNKHHETPNKYRPRTITEGEENYVACFRLGHLIMLLPIDAFNITIFIVSKL